MSPKIDNQVVGGMFALMEHGGGFPKPGFMDSGNLFFANARSALFTLIKLLNPSCVWLPSFLCNALVETVSFAGYTPRFYPIDQNLRIQSIDWIDAIAVNDLVLAIDYFGFQFDHQLVGVVRNNHAWLVEDAVQDLFSSHAGKFSDYSIYSPRKFLGVPDGGILKSHCDTELSEVALDQPPDEWSLHAVQASQLRRDFDISTAGQNWFELYTTVESNVPIGNYAMSDTAKGLLEHGVDAVFIGNQRRQNYLTLCSSLHHLALLPDLPDDVVPLGFPIRVRNRDAVRRALIAHRIYPPIHWDLEGIVPQDFSESHELSRDILTLVCDQRYDDIEMNKTAKLVLQTATSG